MEAKDGAKSDPNGQKSRYRGIVGPEIPFSPKSFIFIEMPMSLRAFSRLTAECNGYSLSRNILCVDTSRASDYRLIQATHPCGLCGRVSNRGLTPIVNRRGVLLVEEGSNNEDTM
jgi:hypothetical protein